MIALGGLNPQIVLITNKYSNILILYCHLLGILLIALRGLNTLIVLIADKLISSTAKQYSKALEKKKKK